MAKQVNVSKVQNIEMRVRFNDPAALPLVNGAPSGNGFYPIVIITSMQAVDDLGGLRAVEKRTSLGTLRATEYTPTELANTVKGSNNSTGNYLLAELTAAYNDAIGGLV